MIRVAANAGGSILSFILMRLAFRATALSWWLFWIWRSWSSAGVGSLIYEDDRKQSKLIISFGADKESMMSVSNPRLSSFLEPFLSRCINNWKWSSVWASDLSLDYYQRNWESSGHWWSIKSMFQVKSNSEKIGCYYGSRSERTSLVSSQNDWDPLMGVLDNDKFRDILPVINLTRKIFLATFLRCQNFALLLQLHRYSHI